MGQNVVRTSSNQTAEELSACTIIRTVAYSVPFQTSKMTCFAKIVNGFKSDNEVKYQDMR